MEASRKFQEKLSSIVEKLPDEKVLEVIDFANFLVYKSSRSAIDEGALLIQQESLKKIWDNPEEDIYEL
jgi:hypothetical protein